MAQSEVSAIPCASSVLRSHAALNLVRRKLRQEYVHECTVDDALRVLEVMPPGQDCVVRRFLSTSPPQYKVKVRGHADDDIYDENTMFSLVHSGAAHFVRCCDTVQTFFRIRTPPQLQRAALEPLFLHPAMPKERAVELLKAHYTQNEQHPDRKSLPHVVMMRVAGGSNEDIETYFIDPHFSGPHKTKGAVLSKRTTLVRACCRFMPAVIVPACTTPSSMVSESHVVSIQPPAEAPAPAPASSGESSSGSSGDGNSKEVSSAPVPSVTSVAAASHLYTSDAAYYRTRV